MVVATCGVGHLLLAQIVVIIIFIIVRSAGCGYSIIWLCGSAIAATASQGHTDILMMAAMYVLVLHSPDVATGKVWWLCVCLLRVRAVIGCWPKDGDIPVADTACSSPEVATAICIPTTMWWSCVTVQGWLQSSGGYSM